MKNTFNVLALSNNGCYVILIPNFELMKFEQTNQVVKANDFTSFGFPFEHKYSERFDMDGNLGVNEEVVKKKVFRASYEKLQKIVGAHGADYVLTDGLDCGPGAINWNVDIRQCQMLIKIHHPHVPATVYRGSLSMNDGSPIK